MLKKSLSKTGSSRSPSKKVHYQMRTGVERYPNEVEKPSRMRPDIKSIKNELSGVERRAASLSNDSDSGAPTPKPHYARNARTADRSIKLGGDSAKSEPRLSLRSIKHLFSVLIAPVAAAGLLLAAALWALTPQSSLEAVRGVQDSEGLTAYSEAQLSVQENVIQQSLQQDFSDMSFMSRRFSLPESPSDDVAVRASGWFRPVVQVVYPEFAKNLFVIEQERGNDEIVRVVDSNGLVGAKLASSELSGAVLLVDAIITVHRQETVLLEPSQYQLLESVVRYLAQQHEGLTIEQVVLSGVLGEGSIQFSNGSELTVSLASDPVKLQTRMQNFFATENSLEASTIYDFSIVGRVYVSDI